MNDEQPDLADLITRIKDTHGVTETEIAKRVGVHVSTVNTWVHHRRVPRTDTLRALAREFPDFTEEEIFAAARRKRPGPVHPEAEERLLALFKALTAEQQEIVEIQLRGVVDYNQRNGTL